MSKYEGAHFGKWRTYFREDQRCWRVIGELDSIVCDVSGPSAEERAALIADAPELLRQREALLVALGKIDKVPLALYPSGMRSALTKMRSIAEEAIAAAKGGA